MTQDDEDAFAAMVEGLDLKADPDDVVDVSALNTKDLLDLFADTRERLGEEGAMFTDLQTTFGTRAGTEDERALHSLRLACLTELRKRGLS